MEGDLSQYLRLDLPFSQLYLHLAVLSFHRVSRLRCNSGTFESDETQARTDEKAFQELQKYAEFQKSLSETLIDDMNKEETYSARDSASLNDGHEHYLPFEPCTPPSLGRKPLQGRLSCPIVIPQRRPGDGTRGWVRAYAPDLMTCGIDQSSFLNFLDSFNEASRVSTIHLPDSGPRLIEDSCHPISMRSTSLP